ncbi:MAG: rod shape-determining protein MreC [Elusimicrobiota bacterium]|jgi:rod shape-determining protein MreC|nr:rod shape-determining protein MreC [Elusimicrobiota bacterium]
MQKDKSKKKTGNYESIYVRWLPAFYGLLALLVIVLPLQKPVNSARAVLSYVFIPQLRAANAVVGYLDGTGDAVKNLINAAAENNALKDEIARLRIDNAQTEALRGENERLSIILNIARQTKWSGIWAKIAYREPSRRSMVIADKGSYDGVELRAPVIGVDDGVVGLLGKVIEVTPNTSKILLSTDDDFFVTAFLDQSRIECLAAGSGRGGMAAKYIPLETQITKGEKVYTSVSSALFPDGVLIGSLAAYGVRDEKDAVFISPPIKLAVDPLGVKEVLILAPIPSGGTEQGVSAAAQTAQKGGKK